MKRDAAGALHVGMAPLERWFAANGWQAFDFQREVWNQLLAIPAGSTRSYLDIAQAIKRPKATRAVAQACGANPVAVVVPCHRVVMSNGSIGGYSGMPGVKRALLAAEGVSRFATA